MIALCLVALAGLIALVELARHHTSFEALVLVGLLTLAGWALAWLLRDLRRHPANFPEATASQGLRLSPRD